MATALTFVWEQGISSLFSHSFNCIHLYLEGVNLVSLLKIFWWRWCSWNRIGHHCHRGCLERWQLHCVMMWNGKSKQGRHEEHLRDPFNSCHCQRQLLKKCHDTVWREVGSQRHPPSLYFVKQFWQNAPSHVGSSHAASQLINSILDWRNLFWKPQHHPAFMTCLSQDCIQRLPKRTPAAYVWIPSFLSYLLK